MKKLMWSTALTVAVVAWGASLPLGHTKITKELKEELRPSIEKGLESPDPLVKAYAALAAGQLKDRTLDKTIVALLENTNTDVRRAAIVSLASRKDKKGVKALEAEIVKAGSGGGYVAAELLPRLPVKVQVQLLKGWINNRKPNAVMKSAALDYCVRFGRGDVFKIMGGVTSAKSAGDRDEFLRRLIANPRKESAGWASKLLSDKRNAEARKGGLQLAMALGGAEVDPIIRKALLDEDASISAIALAYLSNAGDDSATQYLIKILPGSSDKLTVANKLLALDEKLPLELGEGLLAEAKPEDMPLAEALYGVYGSSRDKRALMKLLVLEQSTTITERRMGVAGLGYTRNAQAARVLERTIFDGHREVRISSARGLGLLGYSSSVSILDKAMRAAPNDKELKYVIVEAFGRIKSPASAQKLTFLIRDRDAKVKDLAIEGLANIGDKDAIAALRTVVSLETNPELKLKALLTIMRVDEKSGLSQLGTVLQRPPKDYVDQVSDLSKGIRQQVFLTMLNYKRAEVRTDAIDGLVIIGEGGLQVFRMATKDTFPKDVRDAAILELSRHSSSADTGLFKRLAQAGSDDEKMLSMKWLIRNSDKSMAGFFRTLMNGSKGAAVRHMSAVYAVLKSNA